MNSNKLDLLRQFIVWTVSSYFILAILVDSFSNRQLAFLITALAFSIVIVIYTNSTDKEKIDEAIDAYKLTQITQPSKIQYYVTDEDVVLAVRKFPAGYLKETVVLTGVSKKVGIVREGSGSPVPRDVAHFVLMNNYRKSDAEANRLIDAASLIKTKGIYAD